MDIKELIGEATEYDKKLALEEKKPKSWCKSVSAFANTFGGVLIWGISNDGQVVGLNDPEGAAEKISEIIKSRLTPIPEFKLRFHKTGEGKILVILTETISLQHSRWLIHVQLSLNPKHHIIIREMEYWKPMLELEMKV